MMCGQVSQVLCLEVLRNTWTRHLFAIRKQFEHLNISFENIKRPNVRIWDGTVECQRITSYLTASSRTCFLLEYDSACFKAWTTNLSDFQTQACIRIEKKSESLSLYSSMATDNFPISISAWFPLRFGWFPHDRHGSFRVKQMKQATACHAIDVPNSHWLTD